MDSTASNLETVVEAEKVRGRYDHSEPPHTVTITLRLRAGSTTDAVAKAMRLLRSNDRVRAHATGSRGLSSAAYDVVIETPTLTLR
jgi:hypothetical protein